MQIDAFWKHWQVTQDPFRAEEARDDPVLMELLDGETAHPDFQKIFGQPDRPTTAVVFGEKGSGKTALRVLLERRIAEHNRNNPDRRAYVVLYDDLNGALDRVAQSLGRKRAAEATADLRLVDHQDAILSLAVTQLVDALLTGDKRLCDKPVKMARRMERSRRVDLATLAALYDQPRTSSFPARWEGLKRVLRVGWLPGLRIARWLGVVTGIAAGSVAVAEKLNANRSPLSVPLVAVLLAATVLLLGYWAWGNARLLTLCRRVRKEVRVVGRREGELRGALSELPRRELGWQPIPVPGDQDSRFQLMSRLLRIMEGFGYRSIIVLIDRIDEPTRIAGDPTKMRQVVWPLMNNKFLQQEGVGIKLLLPIELRHALMREDADFFQRARLDKQHMIERLRWSGATLYDLCSRRLQACRLTGSETIGLVNLFEESVTRQDLIDALDQMVQPRDAMKFLYRVIQDHCTSVPQDEPVFRIPRLVLQQVRRSQSQRVQDLQKGVVPG
jgi:hypothetical protein